MRSGDLFLEVASAKQSSALRTLRKMAHIDITVVSSQHPQLFARRHLGSGFVRWALHSKSRYYQRWRPKQSAAASQLFSIAELDDLSAVVRTRLDDRHSSPRTSRMRCSSGDISEEYHDNASAWLYCVRRDGEGDTSPTGGVCLFTSNLFPSNVVTLHTSLQVVAVRIHVHSLVTVCCGLFTTQRCCATSGFESFSQSIASSIYFAR
ncbi:hypothetical protein TNCV_112231 [Trichonephila clavipes]|nr:hypothetical protein TNCV_112231 [Trichonephila clavipes]